MGKIFRCFIIVLICFNAKAVDDDAWDDLRILNVTSTCIAKLKEFRKNVNHGIELIEPAFTACCSTNKILLDLQYLCVIGHTVHELPTLFLKIRSSVQQLEEIFKLIPPIQTLITGLLITDSIEIGHPLVNFATLGLENLHEFVTLTQSAVNTATLCKDRGNTINSVRSFYSPLGTAYQEAVESIIIIGQQIRDLELKRKNFDEVISTLVDERNRVICEAEKFSPCLNALSLARLYYQKNEVSCLLGFYM